MPSIILLMHVEKRFHIGEQLIDRNVRWQCAGIKLKISIRKIFWAHMSARKHNSGFYCRINVNWRSARLLPESRGNWGQGVAGLTTPTVQLKNWIHLHKNAVPGLIPVWRVWYGGGWAKNWSKMMELGELTVGSSDKQRIVVNDGWSVVLLLPGSIHVCSGSRQHSAEIHCLRIIQHFFW